MSAGVDFIDLADDSDSDDDNQPPVPPSSSLPKPSTLETSRSDSSDDEVEILDLVSPAASRQASTAVATSSASQQPLTAAKTSPSPLDNSDILEFGLDDFLGATPATSSSLAASAKVSAHKTTVSLAASEARISLGSINQRYGFFWPYSLYDLKRQFDTCCRRVSASVEVTERITTSIDTSKHRAVEKKPSPGISKREVKAIAAVERKRKASERKQEKLDEKRRKKEVKEGHRIKTGHEIYRYVYMPSVPLEFNYGVWVASRKLELCVRLDSNLTSTDTGRAVIAELDKVGFQSKIVAESYFSQVSSL